MKKLISILLLFLSFNYLTAQAPNDCVNSITVCGNGNFSSNANGIGNLQEFSSCGSFEHNTIWLKITIAQAGSLGFDLIPNNTNISVDYDFWVFGPNTSCSNLGTPIRCSTSNPIQSGSTSNWTGMNLTTAATTQAYNNCCGYVRSLSVLPGQTYYICIDRPVGDGGFQLNWLWSPTVAGTLPFAPPPVANQIPDYKTCSTTNTGIFDLNSVRSQINSDLINITVTFHSTFANSIDNVAPLPNFMANTSNPQTIYVRVTNNLSKCYSTTSFKLIVNPVPTAAINVVNSSVCPNDNVIVNFTGTPNSTIQYSINSGANQSAILNSSGQFSLNQAITVNTTFTLIDVKTLDSNGNTICTQPFNSIRTVTIKPIPVVTATPTPSTICSGATTNIVLSSSPVGATFNWTATQTDISGASAGSGNTISQILTSNSNLLGTANYLITPTLDSCVGLPVSSIINVNPLPVATATPAFSTICSGNPVNIPLTSSLTGTTFSWVSSQNNVSGANAGNGNLINQSLTLTGSTGSVVYTITPTSNSCIGLDITSTITVVNSPTATISYAGSPYCSGLTSANVTFTGVTGGIFSATNGLIINPNTGAVDLSSPVGSYIVTYTIAAGGGCNAFVVTAPITINLSSVPVTGFSYTTPICKNGTNPVVIPVAGFTAGGTYSSTNGLLINSSTGAIDLALSTPGNYTVTYTVPATTCGPVGTSTANIVITAFPTATISYAGTPFCTSLTTGQAVTLTGTDAYTGGAYSSTAGLSVDSTTGAITPSTSTAGNYVVTYTAPASAGCASVPTTTNVVITELPTATISYGGTPFCTTLTTGQAVTLTGTAGYTGGVYSGTAGLTIDATTGAVTPSTSTPGNHTITYTITAAAGCAQVVATANIIVNPIPVATATPSTVTICSFDTTNIALTSNAIGTTYAWTSVATNATGASSGSGTTIPDALTATAATPGTVVYSITPSGSGCTGLPITATVIVNPLPTATISGAATICNGSAASISFSGTPNATVTFTENGGPNQTTTLNNLGSGTVSTGNLTTNTTYQLVSVSSAGTSACIQTQSASVLITVIPVPLVNSIVSSSTICSGQPTGISLSSNVATATFNWTITQSGVIGASAGNGNTISQNLTATTSTFGFVTYSITANEGACQGPVTPITITVNPIPVVAPSTVLQSVCSGSVSPIQLNSNVAGTVFNWNVIQNNVTGASNGTGNSIAQVLTATSNNIGEAVYSVTPTVGGCPGTPTLVTVRVNQIPVVTANAAVTTICSSSTTNIVLTSSIAGTTFSWTVNQTGTFGATPGNGATISQTLTTVNSTQGTVVYSITPTFNGCSGVPITVPIIVNPTPEVFGSAAATICSGESPNIALFPSIAATTFAWTVNTINVIGAQPGTGVVINDILTASPNIGTAVYMVTPTANGCSGIPLLVTIIVSPAPATQINDGVICLDQATNVSFQNYILDTQLSNATYDFVWYYNGVVINGATNNTYEASQSGTYSVIVTNTATGCKSVLTNAVVTASYPGTSIITTETLAFSDNATITVDVNPFNSIYQYTLDNGLTQSSNVFTNVSPGQHIVTVTDENGCTNLTKLVTIIGYPTYFTPNGDSYNDTWNVVGLDASAKVFIYDRYGKLIKQISPTGQGWDGTFNGQPMMSTDYWFTVDYSEPQTGEIKLFRSHFSLKR
jgi:gliding motility-associated-like protein